MAKRLKIAISYNYNESWIGGTYYIENLIYALSKLKPSEQPELLIIADDNNYHKLKNKLNYPYMEQHVYFDDRHFIWRILNNVFLKFKSNLLIKNIKVDAIFPYTKNISLIKTKKIIYWIPDFQEHFLPMFFSHDEIAVRKNRQKLISESNFNLVVSSKDALTNLEEIYPTAKVKTFVLPFAVNLPDVRNLDFKKIKKDFSLEDEYFICPNQFWKHKDHKTLIYAIHDLKNKGIDITVYLTGKTEDYRSPGYHMELVSLIRELGVDRNIISLGFLERNIQIAIIKNAKAVLQPSLFEGWSTVIEDAKFLNKFVIASDLNVHKEQLEGYNSLLFTKGNPISLAEKIKVFHKRDFKDENNTNYENKIIDFGKKFIQIVKDARV